MLHLGARITFVSKLFVAAALACTMSAISIQAQTAVIVPETLNYWAGVNTSNILGSGSSNLVTFTSADTSVFALTVPTVITGLTSA